MSWQTPAAPLIPERGKVETRFALVLPETGVAAATLVTTDKERGRTYGFHSLLLGYNSGELLPFVPDLRKDRDSLSE
jgi:hypothetical protein